MRFASIFKVDYIIIGATIALLFLGVLMLASVSALISQENFGNTTHYLFHQIIWGIVPGLVFGAICFFVPISFFKKWAWLAILASVGFMMLVFIPGLGLVAGGASRWLDLRFFSFQPSELLKIAFILYIAAWLSNPMRKIGKYTFWPFLFIGALVAFLIAKQSDLSTLFVIISTAAIMYFCSNTPIWHIILMVMAGGSALALLIKTSSYRMTRLKVMLGMVNDPMGLGYQVKQILIGIGSGGIIGLGLGMSNQKFGFIPQIMSDSIFAIYSEETGFLGSLLLIFLFVLLLFRGLQIAKRTKDVFSKLFVIGFSCWICIQAFVNMGAMVGLLPLTGIPLPFISYGGTHIIVELMGVGLLLNISKNI